MATATLGIERGTGAMQPHLRTVSSTTVPTYPPYLRYLKKRLRLPLTKHPPAKALGPTRPSNTLEQSYGAAAQRKVAFVPSRLGKVLDGR